MLCYIISAASAPMYPESSPAGPGAGPGRDRSLLPTEQRLGARRCTTLTIFTPITIITIICMFIIIIILIIIIIIIIGASAAETRMRRAAG